MTIDLITIARRINDREQAIGILKTQTLDKASDALREVLLQGADLIRVKSLVKHGQWLPWLSKNCPVISERTARDYMRLASNPQRAADLVRAGSIRKALALMDELESPHKGNPKQWPPYLEAMGRLAKLKGLTKRFPVHQWPQEGIEKFRMELEPLASVLWPEKFIKLEDSTRVLPQVIVNQVTKRAWVGQI